MSFLFLGCAPYICRVYPTKGRTSRVHVLVDFRAQSDYNLEHSSTKYADRSNPFVFATPPPLILNPSHKRPYVLTGMFDAGSMQCSMRGLVVSRSAKRNTLWEVALSWYIRESCCNQQRCLILSTSLRKDKGRAANDLSGLLDGEARIIGKFRPRSLCTPKPRIYHFRPLQYAQRWSGLLGGRAAERCC